MDVAVVVVEAVVAEAFAAVVLAVVEDVVVEAEEEAVEDVAVVAEGEEVAFNFDHSYLIYQVAVAALQAAAPIKYPAVMEVIQCTLAVVTNNQNNLLMPSLNLCPMRHNLSMRHIIRVGHSSLEISSSKKLKKQFLWIISFV